MSIAVPAPRLLLTLILGATLLTACGANDSTSLLTEARAMAAAGDYKAAIIQLKNALAEDENNAEARFELGKLYLDQLNLASAEKEFRRAREAGYATDAVNPMIARALLGQREFQRVLDELPVPADNSPEAATLLALRATAELGLERKEDARKTTQRALQSAPEHPEVHLALAQLALADRDADKAMQEIELALRADPGHLDSLQLKGALLRATGKTAEAAAVYRDVIRIDPRNVNARVALSSIAIAANQLTDARKEVDAALKESPNNLQARYALALIEFREKKTERARDTLASVLKAAPGFAPALLLGGSIEYALGNLQTAEAHLNKVVQATPDNLYALRLLAATQLRQGRPDDAAKTLAPALKAAGQDPSVMVVAGEIALARKDYAEASAYFEQAAQRNPDSAAIRTELGISRLAQGDQRAMADLQAAAGMDDGGSRADTFIILNQVKQKQFDAALASIAALEKKQPANPLTWNYRGIAYLGKNDFVRARDSFGQALKLNPAFFPAAANLAQLDVKDQQPDAARQRFEGILKADPKNLNAMLALADLGLRKQDEKTYVGWLEKAAAAHPQALPPRVALARHQLARGDKSKALATAREAVSAHPDSPLALELLGAAQLASGDTTNALGSYRKLVERQPGLAAPLVKVATAQLAARDAAGARKTLQDALRIQPDALDAQLMLGSLEIQGARFDEAGRLARQAQQQHPGNPAGFILEGDTAFARKDYPAALAAFERAHKLAPAGALLVRQLQVLTASQRAAEGEKRVADWLAAHPQDAGTRAALAERLVTRGQHKAAVEHYLILNKSNPGNLVVLNNLAWALQESGDRRAAAFAEQALKLKPDNPAVLDTLGWILVQQGQRERGIKLLQQALSKAPDAAEIQWHLASAFAQSGDRTRARRELERLLESGVGFPQEPAARALLKQLQANAR
ncbi:MAG: PEP-CTERM system TPR-repeat protein PrsT [Gammaproteobacteria bacterium]|nr:PEP-CTERM system TPR-repeat protein PrsT [Gammaproteobacteria bacterium]MBU1409325.1 PEP-CTERM system TPR-repeat protein PrsT [Gammaproteobacteria bacterium]MBU1531221.1 PEP-CTERM system TPR-repeat protein PrsT [Gammaproteobacteria bacterium]